MGSLTLTPKWAPPPQLQLYGNSSITCCICLYAAAAAQEEAEDLSEAQEVTTKEMAVGTLVITHLTQQDLRAKEILLPKQAVEANILPALTYSLLKFKVLQCSCCQGIIV